MKMSNLKMGENYDVLTDLHASGKCTGKLGYAVVRNRRLLGDAAKEYLDMKKELLEKYGTKSADGNSITLSDQDKIKQFWQDMGEIPQIEHDVDIYTIPEDDFCSGPLNSLQMSKLLWMVEE